MRDGDPAVLAALAARRGPAVMAFASEICEERDVVRAAADAFARFRALVVDPEADVNVHPDALLLRSARRAALDLGPRGPDLGCGPATELLIARAERTISKRDAGLLDRHLESCEHCSDLSERLGAAERAYRDADDTPLAPAALAPMVAALAAAAPVRLPANGAPVLPSGPPSPPKQDTTEKPVAPAKDEPIVITEAGVAGELEAEESPAAVVEDEPDEPPIGTRRVTGAPSSYYELPPLPPRERGRRAKKAARGAAVAGEAAAALGRRAGAAARKRLEKPDAPAPPAPEPAAAAEPEPEPEETRTWARVESIEFPAQAAPEPTPEPDPDPDLYDPGRETDPELEESTARARARTYRRRRHQQQKQQTVVPTDGRPPRLLRPTRDRGPHLPLSAHGPRDLALPAGLLVVAVLVIMAVSGVFGGGTDSPSTGTSATAPAEVSLVSQSATSMSLSDAQQIAARAGTPAP